MAKLTWLVLGLALSANAEKPITDQVDDGDDAEQVCVIIDQMDTGDKKYPNQATEVNDRNKSFDVFHRQEACFDLTKKYYMQYFLWENRNIIVYGTRCVYEPKAEDEGKILRYEGKSGGTPCPVVDEIHID